MIVTLAFAGPFTQSELVTGGKTDSGVGPGVGFVVITVQPESGWKGVPSGTDSTTVGAGRATEVAVEVGVAVTWGRQPAKGSPTSIKNNKNNLRIHISMDKYLAILPVKG